MRTTLTIDDDLIRALKDLAHRHGVPFKAVVNSTLRAGLENAKGPAKSKRRYKCPAFSLGEIAPGFNLDKALALAAALEDEEIVRKIDLNK